MVDNAVCDCSGHVLAKGNLVAMTVALDINNHSARGKVINIDSLGNCHVQMEKRVLLYSDKAEVVVAAGSLWRRL